MGLNVIGTLFDAYERPARLYPALLCLLPLVAVAAGVHGTSLTPSNALVSLVASFGLLSFFASISRDMGKRLEKPLYTEWDGKPTTQILRHRFDNLEYIDALTRMRYHEFLGKHLGTTLPTDRQERDDPATADHTYEGAVRYLLEKTREKTKFPLIFKENVHYGFRRNSLGLKPIGILIAVLSILWTLIFIGALSAGEFSIIKVFGAPLGATIALVISIAMALAWTFLVTKNAVRRTAFAYAIALLRACDKLPKKK